MRLEAWLLAPVFAGCASIQSISRPPPTSEQCEVRRVGGPGDDGASEGLVLDVSGGGAVTGFFSETVDLGGGPTHSQGGTDVFVTRFGPSDEPLWTRSLGGSSDDRGFGVALDAQGNVYATGGVVGTVDFGTGPTSVPGVELSCFVAKLAAADGRTSWAVRFPGPGAQYCREIALDREGDVWMTGAFSQRIQLGGFVLESAGSNDIFVARLEPTSGQVKNAWRIGGKGNDLSRALAIDPRGRVLVAGQFSGRFRPRRGCSTLAAVCGRARAMPMRSSRCTTRTADMSGRRASAGQASIW
jgi:hypothetical protein